MDYLEEAKKEILGWFAERSLKPGDVMMIQHKLTLKNISIKNPMVTDKFEEAFQSLIDEDKFLAPKGNEMWTLTQLGYNSEDYQRILEEKYQ